MDYFIVCGVALSVSAISLASGFGLGTVLMPAFALFFPVPTAIAATAVVHLANNVFKIFLIGRHADWDVIRRFALPGACAAIFGAMVLSWCSQFPPLAVYYIGDHAHSISLLKLVIGVLIIVFACFELIPSLNALRFERRYLVHGGLVSGFFGGLSGNQGELRSAFLLKIGLGKEAFIGTGAVSAVIVDVARLVVYGVGFYAAAMTDAYDVGGLVAAATLAAFAGAVLGAKLLTRMTLRSVHALVGGLLIVAGCGMAAGLL